MERYAKIGWEGLGLAVQSYQKRAWYVLDWLALRPSAVSTSVLAYVVSWLDFRANCAST